MRAAIFDPYLDTGGGGERYMLTAASALKKGGWNVDLVWRGHSRIIKWLEERLGLDLSGINIVPDAHRGADYDFVFWLSDGSIPFLFGKKNVIHFQTPFRNTDGKSFLNRIKYFKIHDFVCNSQFTKNIIDGEYGINAKVIYPPVDLESLQAKRKENIILFVGRYSQLQQAKRQDLLVESFKDLYKDGLRRWKLVLIGGSDIGGSTYVNRLKAASIGFPIDVLENLPYTEVRKFYAKAKIFWSASGFGANETTEPSRVEHFGITVVEAQATKCVPIVTNKGGHKEIVENEKSGFLWNSPNELKQITLDLVKNPERMEKIADNGLVCSQLFSQKVFEKNILQLVA